MTFMEHPARGFHNTPIRGVNGPSPGVIPMSDETTTTTVTPELRISQLEERLSEEQERVAQTLHRI